MSDLSRGISALSVRRPVLILVANLLIILCGIASIAGIDIRELPNVDRPIVSVRASFDGASPQTMDSEITRVLENAVSRVAGVKSIKSSSEENNMRMRVEFATGMDLDTAASDVREAVNRVQRQLPDNIDQLLVVKADDDAQAIIELSAYSDSLSQYELAERIEKDVVPELQSIAGVAEVRLEGEQPRVLNILLSPSRLAGYKLSVSDVVDVLRTINIDIPVGSFKSNDQDLLVRAQASAIEPDVIKSIYVRDSLRIGDIAEVFYGPMEAESYTLLNGRGVIGLGIVRQAGANTIAIAEEVDKRLAQVNARMSDITLVKTSDDSLYITGALKDVLYTLLFSIAIVVVVIALFIGQWRSVLIPIVTIPVALIGTLAVIWLFGFSINLLTLLALVLATGLIVDDAIIVLENIQRQRALGLDPMAAAVIGTRQVFFAVIATTITLVAVFVPIAFLPGETGKLFREFGLVIATAVVISSFVAVTLCPMLSARLGNLNTENACLARLRRPLDRAGATLSRQYFRSLEYLMAGKKISLLIALTIALGGVFGFYQLNQELLPQEDRGVIRIALTGPDGASLNYADRQSQIVESVLAPYREQGVITDIYTIVGRWDKNRSYTVATLQHWDQRQISQQALAKAINTQLADMPGAQVRVIQDNSLNIRSTGGGLELALLGNDYEQIYAAANTFADALQAQISVIDNIRVQFDTSQPELAFTINRARANDLNVPITRISDTLQVMVDRLNLLDLSIEDQSIPLMISAGNGSILDPADLLNVSVTNTNNELIPLSSLVTVMERGVSAELDRHEQRRAIELDIGLPPGTPLGDTLDAVKAVADDVLPAGISVIYLGEAATLQESSYGTAITFIIALIVVFLVLAAQFESIGSAFIVMFTVPFGLAAAVFALLLTGQSLNLYSQIGLVMLIGLMTKNAILLIEFMDQLRDEGREIAVAIREAVRIRLRPVIMTVLSTVLGALPLILSAGPGAEARNAIGWVIFAGLGLSTLFTLYFAPLGYALIAPHLKPRAHAGRELEQQLARAASHSAQEETS